MTKPTATAGPGPTDLVGPVTLELSWRRVLVFWHLAFTLLVGLTGAVLVTQAMRAEGGWPKENVLAVGALGILILAYVAFAPRAMQASLDDRFDWRIPAYLTLLFAVTSVVSWVDSVGTTLLFVAFSQVWLLARSVRVGAWQCVILTVLVTGAVRLRLHALGGESTVVTMLQMTIGLVFSLLMGLWLHTIIRQGTQRAHLLASLQAAQEELGRSQHAAGIMAERERIAREIHDTVAQGLTSIVMLSQVASATLEKGDTAQTVRRLQEVELTARENLAEARALVAAFSPAPLAGGSLTQALDRAVTRLGAETGINTTADLDDAAELSSPLQVVLLRAAQEALSNVRRHSRAGSVEVTLRVQYRTAVLTVRDDGVGFAPDAVEGFGLRGMRDRATLNGGTVTVGPSPAGPGTLVQIKVEEVAHD